MDPQQFKKHYMYEQVPVLKVYIYVQQYRNNLDIKYRAQRVGVYDTNTIPVHSLLYSYSHFQMEYSKKSLGHSHKSRIHYIEREKYEERIILRVSTNREHSCTLH